MVLGCSNPRRHRGIHGCCPTSQSPPRTPPSGGPPPAASPSTATLTPLPPPAAFPPPPPPPPQTNNSPTPPSNRLPSHPHSKNSKQEDKPQILATPPALPSQDASKMTSLRSRDSEDKGKTAAAKGKAEVQFNNSLTAKEITKDFIAMTGSKPPSQPKRRHRSVQEDVNEILPLLRQPGNLAFVATAQDCDPKTVQRC